VPVSATPGTQIGHFVTVLIAEKGEHSTDDIAPVQGQYRIMHGSQDDKFFAAIQ
jgi:hypothetical protein